VSHLLEQGPQQQLHQSLLQMHIGQQVEFQMNPEQIAPRPALPALLKARAARQQLIRYKYLDATMKK